MTALQIRPATADDLAELNRIYNHYVTHTHITFDTEAITLERRRAWFDGFSDSGPHRLLVAEAEAGIVGYASSSRFRPKPAYLTSAECTVYLDPSQVGLGFGRRLYGALLEALAGEPAVHRALGGVALPNPASIALHESLGFRLVGTFREVGHKFGKFWDVSWFEKELYRDGQKEGPRAGEWRPSHLRRARHRARRFRQHLSRAHPPRRTPGAAAVFVAQGLNLVGWPASPAAGPYLLSTALMLILGGVHFIGLLFSRLL